ncbi:MAG: ISAs1 family transposase [Legionella sp.]|nr:ISAs1 family transposase [Legionella sp.]
MIMKISIIDHFSTIQDPRQQSKIDYELLDILFLCVVAMVCGAEAWHDIELVGKARLSWFQSKGFLLTGVPISDTIARIIARLNPDEFRSCFIQWMASASSATLGQIVPIDGKQLRGSYDNKKGNSAIHMVSAFAAENGVVLGQIKTEVKSNEITAIPVLLDLLDIKGCIVTIDAMGCQVEIAAKIINKKADYVLAVKENQKNLSDEITDFFDCAKQHDFKGVSHDYFEEISKGHGRVETRKYWISDCLDTMDSPEKWAGIKGIGMVESERYIKGITTIDRRYYIATLEQNAVVFAHAVRSHWGIENKLHWVLDVTFKEDSSRVRKDNGAENLSIVRHITLNIFRQDKTSKESIKGRRYMAALDSNFADKVLDGLF